ncbi:penicillin-binding protein activator LpoB [Candidatus Avelusimicrobium gallicola]|uniref:Penicillin-binding protein activator LpoB n=1 Tax=Candidatus Avelusimicrobium gallicola TaxID=2562704 RepID=A0A1Y4DIG9_9BACT|nr:penicillin-binding protein activator LpoB [Elusimicrobium sp. An273]OUO57459.1 penicillin-binding protein activator LpoB [Elusimicrobium sp. An273]
MKKYFIALLAMPLLFACAPSVKRVETNLVKDVSGGWNDTDAQMVAQEMITDCLQGGWYNRFLTRNGKEPTVIVGTVTNNTMEHINTGVFIESMQRALINSAKVDFVASADERGEIRTERLEQDEFASEATRKAFGQEIGADYMLSGVLNSVVDQSGSKAVVFYQVNLKLIDIETNQIVWNGQKQIKKYVKRSKVTW